MVANLYSLLALSGATYGLPVIEIQFLDLELRISAKASNRDGPLMQQDIAKHKKLNQTELFWPPECSL